MKKLFTLLLVSLISSCLYAQTEEKLPEISMEKAFKGGSPAFNSWLVKKFRYPNVAIENNYQGTVETLLVVEADGKISSAKVIKGMENCPECDAEALRLVGIMPKLIPAEQNGEPVRTQVLFILHLRLN